jgi:hypothetical protein
VVLEVGLGLESGLKLEAQLGWDVGMLLDV